MPLDLEPLCAADVVEGSPRAGHVDLDATELRCIGVWEMTPGTARDVESSEVFVVLTGEATVSFDDPHQPAIELRAGSLVRLRAGMRTIWTVRETLRKVYIAP
ncbi:cupin domain-containing protein [Ruicaihuangia caeni]|uniref:cupin domain-containing protein n=1 Tax=Ruicaihuangia caeni TaxID=3042517 RepID=UPI00338FFF9C